MTLKIKTIKKIFQLTLFFVVAIFSIQGTCRYSLKDVSIPAEVKTVRVLFIENKARYINPQLSPRLTDKLRQKIVNQTRLSQTNNDADYEISGYISDYSVSTSGISQQRAASNNLNVTVHIIFKNRLDEKKNFEADLTRNFPFDANISLTQAEAGLNDQIINNLTDEIFNRIFSNW
jgi:outer membrane lipopolysaccharide assembly protein LptE/RlpB